MTKYSLVNKRAQQMYIFLGGHPQLPEQRGNMWPVIAHTFNKLLFNFLPNYVFLIIRLRITNIISSLIGTKLLPIIS